jgi:hypothetical protein
VTLEHAGDEDPAMVQHRLMSANLV